MGGVGLRRIRRIWERLCVLWRDSALEQVTLGELERALLPERGGAAPIDRHQLERVMEAMEDADLLMYRERVVHRLR